MAITFGDQGSVDLGRSRVNSSDSYVREKTLGGDASGLEQLSKALSSLGVDMQTAADRKVSADREAFKLYSGTLSTALKGGIPTEDDVNNVLSNVHPLVRARAAQDYGYTNGLNSAYDIFKNIPFGLSPEEAQARYAEEKAKALEAAKGNPSYMAGVAQAFDEVTQGRIRSDGQERINNQRQIEVDAFGTRFANGIRSKIDAYKNAPVGTPSQRKALIEGANQLGIDAGELAAIISFETGGSFSPSKRGGMNKDGTGAGTFLGLIQFSPANQKALGVHAGQTFDEQIGAVVSYLKRAGVKPGMGILDVYSAILTGAPGRYDKSDVNGSVREHVDNIVTNHRANALKFLGEDYTPGQKADASTPGRTQVASLPPTTVNDASGEVSPSTAGSPTADGSPQPVQPIQTAQAGGVTATDAPALVSPALRALQEDARREFVKYDELYKRTGISENRARRDRAAEELRLIAKEKMMPELLDSLPPNLLTPEIRTSFDQTRKEIRAEAEHRQDRALKEASQRRQKAYADAETKVLTDSAKGIINPREYATVTYIDENGKKRTDVDSKLYDTARRLNDEDRITGPESVVRAADLNDKLRSAYISRNWKEIFRDDPRMLSLLGDRSEPTDSDVRRYIASSEMNKDQKIALIGSLDRYKDFHNQINDTAVKTQFTTGVGKTVETYLTLNPVASKLATSLVGDKVMQEAVTNLRTGVRDVFESRYLLEYESWLRANPGKTPSENDLRPLRDKAEKSAIEFFKEQREIIDKGMTGGASNGQQGQRNSQQQGRISENEEDYTTETRNGKTYIIPKDKSSTNGGAQIPPVQSLETQTSRQVKEDAQKASAAQRANQAKAREEAIAVLMNDPFVVQARQQVANYLRANNPIAANNMQKMINDFIENALKEKK